MDEFSQDSSELLCLFRGEQGITGSLEEAKLIDNYISKFRDGKHSHEAKELIEIIQDNLLQGNPPHHKPLQLLRFLTKPGQLRECLKE